MSNSRKKKIVFVAMSGGVDSSVAAALLKKQGYDVVGVHIKCYNIDGCGERDAEDARRVAEQLKIPFYVFDLEKEYKDKVVRYMIDGYKKGITPNPDVMCNKEIKFGLFLKKALELGTNYVATGHYVRLIPRPNSYFYGHHLSLGAKNPTAQRVDPLDVKLFAPPRHALRNNCQFALFSAKDTNKDQSYFLWTLTQDQLKHCLFPIGEYTKPQVRQMAERFGLLTAKKKDSQGICFLGKVKLDDFLAQYIKPKTGQVKLAQGDGSYKVIGEHNGVYFYTIGQRHGLHLGIKNWESGIKNNFKPLYITDKDIKNNTITVAEGDDNQALYQKEIQLIKVNLVNPIIHNSKFVISVFARVRYRQLLAPANLIFASSHDAKLVFDRAQKFIAPGQSAVFYSKAGELLGGGTIV